MCYFLFILRNLLTEIHFYCNYSVSVLKRKSTIRVYMICHQDSDFFVSLILQVIIFFRIKCGKNQINFSNGLFAVILKMVYLETVDCYWNTNHNNWD